MFFNEALPFVQTFLDDLDRQMREETAFGLSRKQKYFLGMCLMGIFLTNSVCWKRFERATLGSYSVAALSWMFRRAPIPWHLLLAFGVRCILQHYQLNEGVLVIDDTDRQRAKTTTEIAYAHKVFDKKTGGYFNGQTIVFLLLVTRKITLPIGFAFYRPAPSVEELEKQHQRREKKKGLLSRRTLLAEEQKNFPKKEELALQLLQDFTSFHPTFRVKAVLGDNHYGSASFFRSASEKVCPQIICRMKCNQLVRSGGKIISVREYFHQNPPAKQKFTHRGGENVTLFVGSARLYVPSHKQKRFVIAMKTSEEEEFRFLLASDMTWRTLDIVQTWTLRWLIEVFIQDFKGYEGWGQLAKQVGVDGSRRGLTLSLLCDLCLFLHPSQEACLKTSSSTCTVGSLQRLLSVEALSSFMTSLFSEKDPYQTWKNLCEKVYALFLPQPSQKHMNHRQLNSMEPSPSLLHRRSG